MSDGIKGDSGEWDSQTYTPPDSDSKTSENTETKSVPMSTGAEYGAIVAGLLGVLAMGAAKNSSNSGGMTVSSGNGIWVPEAAEDMSKSSTYSSVLDRLINGNNKVVIGVDNGWVSYGKDGLQANAFTGDNNGITIGDNGTPQVVIVNGQDTADSSADITLAHELTHALRGELGIKSMDTTGGVNKDEEAHTIEVEDQIRRELGYDVRNDGDTSDGGDGSYGEYSDASEENDWYNNIDKITPTKTLSGNAYSYDDEDCDCDDDSDGDGACGESDRGDENSEDGECEADGDCGDDENYDGNSSSNDENNADQDSNSNFGNWISNTFSSIEDTASEEYNQALDEAESVNNHISSWIQDTESNSENTISNAENTMNDMFGQVSDNVESGYDAVMNSDALNTILGCEPVYAAEIDQSSNNGNNAYTDDILQVDTQTTDGAAVVVDPSNLPVIDTRDNVIGVVIGGAVSDGATRGEGSIMAVADITNFDID